MRAFGSVSRTVHVMNAPLVHTSAQLRVPSLTGLLDEMSLSTAEVMLGLATPIDQDTKRPKSSVANLEWTACCGLLRERQSV
jgi:hypothetical protein